MNLPLQQSVQLDRQLEVSARSNPLWFKSALIYEAHVKAFYDSNNDGIGDFEGMRRKLDYLQDLGITALWLLPFYPSPLKDDGYDIAKYRGINPAYGTMRDFRRLVRGCHDRGIRVITELVINHTSDQHRWFQRARRAKPGSTLRDFYVWSDTDQKYKDVRIIFRDTEKSNWTWDPVANAYYWHRFYSHQPDLNFDNPRLLEEIIRVMRFWLDTGVDGLRLDAIPYLIEREGTICENLPETHEVIRKIRAEIDARYPDRMLLAEANQWPEDVSAYFGLGDECHMCFHFPLMPRIYMAIAQEDRHPITDIMRQTPEIPGNCQWAIFLRNHDELTLEMVTDKERDYLWSFYATDPRMRLNLGIRRRLAPLLSNDRHKIELLNSLLLSMPGTPVLYYGDEIGMGDNVYLGDRDGVRTPMQWSLDRNGGFSACDPQRLYLPPIMDPIYGYNTVNVEAQARSSSSLLNWMKRLIAVCKQHSSFGLGTLKFLYPGNRKVLAYLREHEGEALLCVANLSRAAQAVELDLSRFKGRVPVELLGRSPFPPIGDLPYLLTLPSYGFYWFVLPEWADAPRWHDVIPEPVPEFTTLVMRDGWHSLTTGREANELASSVLPNFIAKQRWFAAKDDHIARADATVLGTLGRRQLGDYLLLMATLDLEGRKESQHYFLPLDASWDEAAGTMNWPLTPFTLAKARRGSKVGAIYDAFTSDQFVLALIDAMHKGTELSSADGTTKFASTEALAEIDWGAAPDIRRLGVEQSNSSVIISDHAVLKIFRRLSEGEHPELEIARFLTEVAHFQNTPPLLGTAEQVGQDGRRHALAILTGFVRNQGDGWVFTTEYLDRIFDDVRVVEGADTVAPEERHAAYLGQIATLARRTAELHIAFASGIDEPNFKPEPIRAADIAVWAGSAKTLAQAAFAQLAKAQAAAPEAVSGSIDTLLERKDECFTAIDQLGKGPITASKTRIHGDYHLGQVLVAKNDFYIIDFEGEPTRTLQERRLKSSPFKDVAGMLRSFEYAEWSALFAIAEHEADSVARLLPFAEAWRQCAQATFLNGYFEAIGDCPSCPKDRAEADRLLNLFTLEKALYEICYEATNRPTWLRIPIAGLQTALDSLKGQKGAGDGAA
ncbi:maltose alpha-D-glucosyltransferase [Dongia deserti]|uniref:maltose alpha-D-glucosyltransferase n=1 Tax=Dongia deserti TaxID=2268030 RepID=UPI000E64748A|nr:maltose alpha-D-glucosyltransferase [Dongia deserti]